MSQKRSFADRSETSGSFANGAFTPCRGIFRGDRVVYEPLRTLCAGTNIVPRDYKIVRIAAGSSAVCDRSQGLAPKTTTGNARLAGRSALKSRMSKAA